MKKNFLVLLSLVFLLGCAGVTVQPDKATVERFAGEKTFAWLSEGTASDDVRVNNPTVKKMVEASVDTEMIKKGYQKVDPKDADLLVSWFGSVDEEVKEIHVSSFYKTYGYGTLVGNVADDAVAEDGKVKQVYQRGTLIVDIIDPQTKKILFRDTATNAITKKMSNAELAKYINTSVLKILAGVPDADH